MDEWFTQETNGYIPKNNLLGSGEFYSKFA